MAADYDLFLSYRSLDRARAEEIARRLRGRGLSVFFDQWWLEPGQNWFEALERALGACRAFAVVLGGKELGPWQKREVGVAFQRHGREHDFRLIPLRLDGADPPLGFLHLEQWVDWRDPERALALLELAVRREPPGPDFDAQFRHAKAGLCPYRGLETFREFDERFFVGREKESDELLKIVRAHPFTVVRGPSGTGKSSLVQAGLVPRLRRDSEHRWDVLTLVPGWRPLHSLAGAILERIEPDLGPADRSDRSEKWGEELVEGKRPLRAFIDDLLRTQPGTNRLLLVIDQAEELFTQCREDRERKQCWEELERACADERLRVLFTIRSDFATRLEGLAREAETEIALEPMPLGALGPKELQSAIERPAALVGLTFEEGLVVTILKEVQAEPGRLPLLEFLLKEMWSESHGQNFDLATYDTVGRVEGAIARRAEKELQALSDADRAATARLFLQLVQVGEGTRDTRERAPMPKEGSAEYKVALQFADSRLLTTSGAPDHDGDTVEVSHEALTTNWPWLVDLVGDKRPFLTWRKRVRAAAREYAKEGDASALLRGRYLDEAFEIRRQYQEYITPGELALVEASLAAKRAEERAAQVRKIVLAALVLFALAMATQAVVRSIELERSNKALQLQGIELKRSNQRLLLQGMGWTLEQAQRALRYDYPSYRAQADEMRYWLGELDRLEEELEPLARAELARTPASREAGVENPVDAAEAAFERSIRTATESLDQWRETNEARLERLRNRLSWLEKEEGRSRLDEYEVQWSAARAAIRESALYTADPALQDLPYVRGFVPLGENTQKTLRDGKEVDGERVWLFAHLPTGALGETMPALEELHSWSTKPGSGGLIFALIPGGPGRVGEKAASLSAPNVHLEAFYCATTEVTEGQWTRFEPSSPLDTRSPRPVTEKDWFDSRAFSEWAGCRLPSEAEWEYAARAGTITRYWSGDTEDALRQVAWVLEGFVVREGRVRSVGTKLANPFGLFDVHGNAGEWCEDVWHIEFPSEPSDGSTLFADASAYRGYRVHRGGSAWDPAGHARSDYRDSWWSSGRFVALGFRPARSVATD